MGPISQYRPGSFRPNYGAFSQGVSNMAASMADAAKIEAEATMRMGEQIGGAVENVVGGYLEKKKRKEQETAANGFMESLLPQMFPDFQSYQNDSGFYAPAGPNGESGTNQQPSAELIEQYANQKDLSSTGRTLVGLAYDPGARSNFMKVVGADKAPAMVMEMLGQYEARNAEMEAARMAKETARADRLWEQQKFYEELGFDREKFALEGIRDIQNRINDRIPTPSEEALISLRNARTAEIQNPELYPEAFKATVPITDSEGNETTTTMMAVTNKDRESDFFNQTGVIFDFNGDGKSEFVPASKLALSRAPTVERQVETGGNANQQTTEEYLQNQNEWETQLQEVFNEPNRATGLFDSGFNAQDLYGVESPLKNGANWLAEGLGVPAPFSQRVEYWEGMDGLQREVSLVFRSMNDNGFGGRVSNQQEDRIIGDIPTKQNTSGPTESATKLFSLVRRLEGVAGGLERIINAPRTPGQSEQEWVETREAAIQDRIDLERVRTEALDFATLYPRRFWPDFAKEMFPIQEAETGPSSPRETTLDDGTVMELGPDGTWRRKQ